MYQISIHTYMECFFDMFQANYFNIVIPGVSIIPLIIETWICAREYISIYGHTYTHTHTNTHHIHVSVYFCNPISYDLEGMIGGNNYMTKKTIGVINHPYRYYHCKPIVCTHPNSAAVLLCWNGANYSNNIWPSRFVNTWNTCSYIRTSIPFT